MPTTFSQSVIWNFENGAFIGGSLVPTIANPMVVKAHELTTVVGDAGVKIKAAIAMLPVGIGGLVDATGFLNPQNLTGFTIPPGVTVHLAPILFTLPSGTGPVIVNEGAHLIGMGANSPGATILKAFTNFTGEVVKCVSTTGVNGWWHNAEVRNLRIDGNKVNNANNATGHGLTVYGVGETSVIQGVNILNCKQSGLYIHGSQSGTGTIENVTCNTCDLYGVQIDDFRSALTLKGVGGDNSPITFGITAPSNGGGGILLIDPKSETSGTNEAGSVVLITGGSAKVSLTIVGGNFLTSSTGNKTIVRLAANSPADHQVQILGLWSGNNMPVIVDDLRGSVSVATPATTYHGLFCYCGGKSIRFDSAGWVTVP